MIHCPYAHPLDHMETVGKYIHFSDGFRDESIHAVDLLPSASSSTDPLYAVVATRK